jgi:hypothetical protein
MTLRGISMPALLIGGGGLLFLWSGMHGASLTASLRDLVAGKQPPGTNVNPISGGAVPGTTGTSGTVPPVTSTGGLNQANRSLGRMMAAARGWTGSQWNALDQLWTRESEWQNTIANPSSGAYGIAQALPPTKYPPAGQASGGSSARAQIQWGLSYIAQRYGSPEGAWAHEQSFGWY